MPTFTATSKDTKQTVYGGLVTRVSLTPGGFLLEGDKGVLLLTTSLYDAMRAIADDQEGDG